MKNLLYFALLIILSGFLFSSFTKEEVLTQEVSVENEDLNLLSCSPNRVITVMSTNWNNQNNTACPGGDLVLEAFGLGRHISWTIYGATLVSSGGPVAIVNLPQTDSNLSFTATDSNNCSVTLYGRVITYGDCFFSQIPNLCAIFPNHPSCDSGDGIGDGL